MDARKELIAMLNRALELEHAAYVQYLSHRELIDGLGSEPLIGKLKEISGDEAKHAETFRKLIGDYLGGTPSMGIAETHRAGTIQEILKANLKDEKFAEDYYQGILRKVQEHKLELKYAYHTLEHDVRHIIIDEQEHISELKKLLGMK